MTPAAFGVGIVGASTRPQSWARESHVPAIAAAGLRLVAVASRSRASADDAARSFGADRAYDDFSAMLADPAVDVVAVASPVPTHAALLHEALAAGKHVVSEWPLAASRAEMRELAAAADDAGVHSVIGLQARQSAAVREAIARLRAGAIGRVLSASVLSTTAGFGEHVGEGQLALEDPQTNMNLVTIQAAHTLDLVEAVLGRLAELDALASTQWPRIDVDGSTRPRTIADHVLVLARTADGVPVAAEIGGGRPADDTPFWLQVRGTDGTLALHGGAPRGFQAGRLTLEVDGSQVALPSEDASLGAAAVNVTSLYAALRDALDGAERRAPDFTHAVHLGDLVGSLLAAADDGARPTVG